MVFKKIFNEFIYSYVKIQSFIVASFFPKGSWFEKKNEFTLYEASTKVLAFLPKWFLRVRFYSFWNHL